MKPVNVVIIGRPNVGKSTLFNRLLRERRALVHNRPGVTRDRIEGDTKWIAWGRDWPVALVDTGGLGGETFDKEIRAQVSIALAHADVAVFVFDGRAGWTNEDRELLVGMKRQGLDRKIPVIGVVNKVDDDSHEEDAVEFHASGLDPLLTISAEHGRGIEDLEEAILLAAGLGPDTEVEDGTDTTEPEAEAEETETARAPRVPRIAIVGKPNVGKSTLLNAFLGRTRVITSDIAGTTVDSVDMDVEIDGHKFVVVDTAGIRRKSKTEQGIEVLSVLQAKKALERADLALLVIDGEEGPAHQDERIAGLIEDAGAAVVIVVNKWDTQRRKEGFDQNAAAEHLRKKFRFLNYAPIVFTSALHHRGIVGLGGLFSDILEQRRAKVATSEFSEWVRREAEIHNPRNARFYLSHQTGHHPPSFVCHVSDPKKVHFSLERHLVNAIRDRWGFMGSPVRLKFVKR